MPIRRIEFWSLQHKLKQKYESAKNAITLCRGRGMWLPNSSEPEAGGCIKGRTIYKVTKGANQIIRMNPRLSAERWPYSFSIRSRNETEKEDPTEIRTCNLGWKVSDLTTANPYQHNQWKQNFKHWKKHLLVGALLTNPYVPEAEKATPWMGTKSKNDHKSPSLQMLPYLKS